MSVVIVAVPLGHGDEAAIPHERPELRAGTDVDPPAKDEAVGDAIAGRNRSIAAVAKWSSATNVINRYNLCWLVERISLDSGYV